MNPANAWLQSVARLTLDEWAQVATIVGAIVAIVGAIVAILVLGYTAQQVKANTRISRGQFWLELRKMFAEHDGVHHKLRPGGAWHASTTHPQPGTEMAEVEAYMGLFEHCEIMLEDKLLDKKTFENIYAYRLNNIVNNERIKVDKLQDRAQYWAKFIALLDRCGKMHLLDPSQKSWWRRICERICSP
jgi:hypothetical protein